MKNWIESNKGYEMFSHEPTKGRSGNSCLKINPAKSSPNWIGQIVYVQPNIELVFSGFLDATGSPPLTNGHSIQFRAYIYRGDIPGTGIPNINFNDPSQFITSKTILASDEEITYNWTKEFSHIFDPGDLDFPASGLAPMVIMFYVTGTDLNSIYIDDVQLNKGGVALPYQPHITDYFYTNSIFHSIESTTFQLDLVKDTRIRIPRSYIKYQSSWWGQAGYYYLELPFEVDPTSQVVTPSVKARNTGNVEVELLDPNDFRAFGYPNRLKLKYYLNYTLAGDAICYCTFTAVGVAVINGALVVEGSITSEHIVAGTLDGNRIMASSDIQIGADPTSAIALFGKDGIHTGGGLWYVNDSIYDSSTFNVRMAIRGLTSSSFENSTFLLTNEGKLRLGTRTKPGLVYDGGYVRLFNAGLMLGKTSFLDDSTPGYFFGWNSDAPPKVQLNIGSKYSFLKYDQVNDRLDLSTILSVNTRANVGVSSPDTKPAMDSKIIVGGFYNSSLDTALYSGEENFYDRFWSGKVGFELNPKNNLSAVRVSYITNEANVIVANQSSKYYVYNPETDTVGGVTAGFNMICAAKLNSVYAAGTTLTGVATASSIYGPWIVGNQTLGTIENISVFNNSVFVVLTSSGGVWTSPDAANNSWTLRFTLPAGAKWQYQVGSDVFWVYDTGVTYYMTVGLSYASTGATLDGVNPDPDLEVAVKVGSYYCLAGNGKVYYSLFPSGPWTKMTQNMMNYSSGSVNLSFRGAWYVNGYSYFAWASGALYAYANFPSEIDPNNYVTSHGVMNPNPAYYSFIPLNQRGGFGRSGNTCWMMGTRGFKEYTTNSAVTYREYITVNGISSSSSLKPTLLPVLSLGNAYDGSRNTTTIKIGAVSSSTYASHANTLTDGIAIDIIKAGFGDLPAINIFQRGGVNIISKNQCGIAGIFQNTFVDNGNKNLLKSTPAMLIGTPLNDYANELVTHIMLGGSDLPNYLARIGNYGAITIPIDAISPVTIDWASFGGAYILKGTPLRLYRNGTTTTLAAAAFKSPYVIGVAANSVVAGNNFGLWITVGGIALCRIDNASNGQVFPGAGVQCEAATYAVGNISNGYSVGQVITTAGSISYVGTEANGAAASPGAHVLLHIAS